MSESPRREREPRNPEELIFSLNYGADDEENDATEPDPHDHLPQGEVEDTPAHTYALIYRAASPLPMYQLQTEESGVATDYAIRFVPESMADLPIYDVLTSSALESVPLPHQTLESLPPWARTKLRREGHLKCAGEYNEVMEMFETFSPGWKVHPSNQADELVQILEEVGDEHFVAAVYYFLHTNASEPNASPESIASLRDIQPSSVMNSIREVQKRLEDSSL